MAQLDEAALEAIVAAILTAASVEGSHGVPYMVNRYALVLQELRKAGGPINPMPK